MKYSIYNTKGFYCSTDDIAKAYNICVSYLKENYSDSSSLKEELNIAYSKNLYSFGVRGYIWAEESDRYGKMGC